MKKQEKEVGKKWLVARNALHSSIRFLISPAYVAFLTIMCKEVLILLQLQEYFCQESRSFDYMLSCQAYASGKLSLLDTSWFPINFGQIFLLFANVQLKEVAKNNARRVYTLKNAMQSSGLVVSY